MKLIIAVIKDVDTEPVTKALTAGNYRVTRIASTGGLLRRGVATVLIGLEDDQVDDAIQIIRAAATEGNNDEKRATVFVVNVDRFSQI